MANLPVVFLARHSVLFLGYASTFSEAYSLCKDACKRTNHIFKKANTKCSTTNNVMLSIGTVRTEFPCWLHTPTRTKKSPTIVEVKNKKPKKKGK